MLIHRSIKVFGRVQGVFFRQSSKEKATSLGVMGFARNNADGTVSIEAEGEEILVNEFVEWCKKGPPRAVVDHLEINDGVFKKYKSFTILRGNTL